MFKAPALSGAFAYSRFSSTVSVHRIPTRIRDDRETPLRLGRDKGVPKVIWVFGKPEYFCEKGWTGKSLICPSVD
jgi:hypothetical protein